MSLSVVFTLLLLAAPANAQHEHHAPAPEAGWDWSAETSLFLTGNFQLREFRDFHQVESQNWLMGQAARRLGAGTLALHGMLSFEPFTLRALGSSQVFQTGETFGGAPLIDYQHPHDLLMNLSGAFERPVGPAHLMLRGGLVDTPALGPTPFMHRESARLHPTAPLSHHHLDSTHIAHGVVTAGVRRAQWQLETSAFRGREPDEDRTALDLGRLDSLAVRGSWIGGGTRAQASVGWLEDPHVTEPGDVTRVTASLEHAGMVKGRAVALTLAWGQNRGEFSTEDGYLGEATVGLGAHGTGYLRGEVVDKHILEAGGFHPPGLQHPHVLSRVSALTLGYQHVVWRSGRSSTGGGTAGPAITGDSRTSGGSTTADSTPDSTVTRSSRGAFSALAVGADVTAHATPANLTEAYGRPWSVHLYARWSLRYADRP